MPSRPKQKVNSSRKRASLVFDVNRAAICNFPTLVLISYNICEFSHCSKEVVLATESSSFKALDLEEEDS